MCAARARARVNPGVKSAHPAGDHIGGETATHVCRAITAEPSRKFRIPKQTQQLTREILGLSGREQETVFPIFDDLGNACGPRPHQWTAMSQGFEGSHPECLEPRCDDREKCGLS
jgi:hypothetical protein